MAVSSKENCYRVPNQSLFHALFRERPFMLCLRCTATLTYEQAPLTIVSSLLRTDSEVSSVFTEFTHVLTLTDRRLLLFPAGTAYRA